MSAALHHVAFALASVALGGAGLRIASQAAPAGRPRVLAAAACAAALAVFEALVLGVFRLGGSTLPLLVAALGTWFAAARLLRPAGPRVRDELGGWWRGLGRGERALLGAVAGAFAAAAAYALYRPSLGLDVDLYHYAEPAAWVHSGRPGSAVTLSYDFPFSSYPMTNEVLLTWGAGLARSFAPLALWALAAPVVLALASWDALRAVGARRLPAGLAVAAIVLVPWLARQVNEPLTDLPAAAWFAVCGALVLRARHRPLLLAPAVLAAGLALGTKTTPAVPLVALLAWALWRHRAQLRPLSVPLTAAALLALGVGGPWYVRNWVLHGSPAWPFARLPGSDPPPPLVASFDTSFLARPAATLRESGPGIVRHMAGGLVLLAGGLLAPLLVPRRLRRSALALSAGVLAGTLAWLAAPGTGMSGDPRLWRVVAPFWPVSEARYLVPTIMVAALVLALAASAPGPRGRVALALLAVAAAFSAVEVLLLGDPYLPGNGWRALGAAAGAALALMLTRPWPSRARARGSGAALAVAVLAAGSAVIGHHYLERTAHVDASYNVQRPVLAWIVRQPDFRDGHAPVAFASRALLSPLAGDHFQHRIELIPAREPCDRARARMYNGGWVVASDPGYGYGFLGVRDFPVARCFDHQIPVHVVLRTIGIFHVPAGS